MQINESGFIQIEKNSTLEIDRTSLNKFRTQKQICFMKPEELQSVPVGDVFVFDVETYPNFFYVAFKHVKSGKIFDFERSPAKDLNGTQLLWMLWNFCTAGFNSLNYDILMIELAAKGASCKALKEASDFIIKSGNDYGLEKTTPFVFRKKYGLQQSTYNHVDLIEVAPLQGSLKLYAGRLHCERMQDLPFPDTHILSEEDAAIVRPYCCNDLENTELLFNELAQEIKLRLDMSKEYGVELRSKSDAQIAEAVLNKELEKVLGYYPKRPKIDESLTLSYNVPDFVFFQTEELKSTLEIVKGCVFSLDGNGSPVMPKELEKLQVSIGNSVYKLGMGGLHSSEKCVSYVANEDMELADNDVASFYPFIILILKLFPPQFGEAFLKAYEKIVNTRLDAKKNKLKVIADSLKIVINGSFGKLGNKWSTLYAPQLMLQVTITGQLVLLMLIEMLQLNGISVVSGNTDGFISFYKKENRPKVRQIISMWEKHTGFETEETKYKAIYSRDVNNYIAVKLEGGDPKARFYDDKLGCKTKGTYSERGSALNSILSKNPETLICTDAVLAFIVENKPLEETIYNCKDIRRFVSVRNVKGGAVKNGIYLGKVVRWYYAKGEKGALQYAKSGNKVPKSEGGFPCMDLPLEFPTNIDYDWYIAESRKMLEECGRLKPLNAENGLFD